MKKQMDANPDYNADVAGARSHEAVFKLLGLLLIALGATVTAGWLLQIIELTRLVPGLRGMVLSTALSFVLMGLAIRQLPSATGASAWQRRLPSGMVLLIALLSLLQIGYGIDLVISLPALHAWADDGNPHPGRMALPTALCFLAAAVSWQLRQAGVAETSWRAALGRLLCAGIFLVAGIGLLGYLLNLEAIFGRYPLAGMALHTAIGMLVLATALLLAWQTPALNREQRQSSQILLLATIAPALLALVAGMTGLAVFKSQADRSLSEGLRGTQQARIDHLLTTLELRGTRASILAGRPDLQQALISLASKPADSQAGIMIRQSLDGFMPYGFSSIVLLLPGGDTVYSAGAETRAPELELPVQLDLPATKASLLSAGGQLLLRVQSELSAGAQPLGSLVSEQPLPALLGIVYGGEEIGSSAAMQLCAVTPAALRCLPSRFSAKPYSLPLLRDDRLPGALQKAARNERGVGQFQSASGEAQTAAYTPVGRSGLVSALAIDTREISEPVRQRLLAGGLLISLLTLIGTLLLRSRIAQLIEARLRVSEQYRLVVNTLQEGLILQDHQGRIVTANPAAERILGLSSDEISGRYSSDPFWQVIRVDGRDYPAEARPAMRTLRSGQPISAELMGLRRSDGELRWLSVNTAPFELESAQPHGVVVSFNDITRQHQALARERAAERSLRLFIGCVQDHAIVTLDAHGQITSWNEGAERIMGYDSDEIIGRHFSCFYPAADIQSSKPTLELRQAASEGRYEEEGWRLRKDGRRYWAHVAITAVHDESGQLAGFTKVSRDLTERRSAELALSHANQLREAILEAAPFSIIATDPDGTIRAMNPAAERMLWYARDELIGKATPAVIHDPEEVALRAKEMSAELGEDIKPGFEVFVYQSRRGIVEEREWTYIRRDGSRFPVNLAVTALRDEGQHGEISGFLGIAYDITQRKRREEYTRHVAHHDFLTGLPNRSLLNDRMAVAIQQARRSGKSIAVLMLDLDHFKRVNDSLGHHIGDQLLVTVTKRMLASVRGSDTVARMGGDEFAVILPEVSNSEAAMLIAHNIIEAVSEPIRVGSHELHVTPSLGVSLYPKDGEDMNALLKNADTAMYRAKSAGRRTARLFSAEMERAVADKMAMETALRRAIKNQEFVMHYQPQVSLKTGAVVGMEALLRWPDPQLGMIASDRFIPVAEETGLILPIGDWVLETACRQGRALQLRTGIPLMLAINLSPRQFRQPDLLERLQALLTSSGLPAETLELEITENLLMSNAEESIERLHRIRALGVGISIDDFGVGYSSLSYITRFPISTLKIDRSFVSNIASNPSDAAVAQTIIILAASLNIRVVAEGVENLSQLQFLRHRNCPDAQGYYFSAAVPEERFSAQGFHFGPVGTAGKFGEDYGDLAPPHAGDKRLN